MIAFTEQEKAVIMLGTASVTTADSFNENPNQTEIDFAKFLERSIRPTQKAYQLFDEYFHNPINAYSRIQNSSLEKKRIIKTFFIYMCACDGPINEGEQTALDLLDDLCGFPYMSMSDAEDEYKAFFGL